MSSETTTTKPIYIQYDGNWYDVTAFEHPGEGIRGVYLENYRGKTIDAELHTEHSTNEPYELLEEAKAKGACEGIRFIGKDLPLEQDSNEATEANK